MCYFDGCDLRLSSPNYGQSQKFFKVLGGVTASLLFAGYGLQHKLPHQRDIFIFRFIFTFRFLSICVHIYIYICTYTCVYIFTYVYTYTTVIIQADINTALQGGVCACLCVHFMGVCQNQGPSNSRAPIARTPTRRTEIDPHSLCGSGEESRQELLICGRIHHFPSSSTFDYENHFFRLPMNSLLGLYNRNRKQ